MSKRIPPQQKNIMREVTKIGNFLGKHLVAITLSVLSIGIVILIALWIGFGQGNHASWIIYGGISVAAVGVALSIVVERRFQRENLNSIKEHQLSDYNRQQLLSRVRFLVQKTLEQSLNGASLLELNLHTQSDAVANSWGLQFYRQDQPERRLPPGTSIIQAYDEAGSALLILGEPGSGKTTLLLELALSLIQRAEQDDISPIPIVYNLASWSAHQPTLEDWLIEEMYVKYQMPRMISKAWVARDQIILLLDGLDEVAQEVRASCVEAINSYQHEHLVSLVVCSRTKEYMSQPAHLSLNAAVVIEPFTKEQIDLYLTRAGKSLAGLRKAIKTDPTLQELASNPLMLNVLTLAYQGLSIEEINLKKSSMNIQQRIWATYVQRVLDRRGVPLYPPEDTIYWLIHLARWMIQYNLVEFSIQQIQPDWIPNPSLRRKYMIISKVLTSLVWMLILGSAVGIIVSLIEGVVIGVFVGLFTGAAFGLIGISIPSIKRRILRIIMWQTGYWPWNSLRFLDYAAERILLRRIGNRYAFIHRLLMDYFAGLDSQPVPFKESSEQREINVSQHL